MIDGGPSPYDRYQVRNRRHPVTVWPAFCALLCGACLILATWFFIYGTGSCAVTIGTFTTTPPQD